MFSGDELGKYGLIFGMLVAAGFGAPIPEEIPIATGGVMVGRAWVDPATLPPGESQAGPHWYIMLPLCILGVVLCDTILYVAGRKWGRWLIRKKWVQRRLLSPERFQKIEKNFHDYGIRILLIARILPGIRTPVFLSAGIVRLPFRKFLLADAIYAIPGVNLIFWLAYWLTDAFMNLLHRVESYRELAVVAILSFVAGFLTATFVRRPVATGSPEELPVLGKPVVTIANPQVPEQKVGDTPIMDGRAHRPSSGDGSDRSHATSANGQTKPAGDPVSM
jgi:membrane protein DedA with SNARE-associated domain